MNQDAYQHEEQQNIPSSALMLTAFSTTFGNMDFLIQPASPGEVHAGFDTIPGLSLEALIYQQQASNPMTAPVMIRGGSNTGQQVMSGQYTMQDNTQTSRYQMGFQSAH